MSTLSGSGLSGVNKKKSNLSIRAEKGKLRPCVDVSISFTQRVGESEGLPSGQVLIIAGEGEKNTPHSA